MKKPYKFTLLNNTLGSVYSNQNKLQLLLYKHICEDMNAKQFYFDLELVHNSNDAGWHLLLLMRAIRLEVNTNMINNGY